ncbi:hypothetical protein A1Q2_07970 [Trichosporon asahii var. asahii CBS 8904]|uniref:N-acetyltransferase domain-containing protein n=2 Tax=Trichosporon asahii var. asahii TaxID=189963 RepID=K1VFB9_TRIAC|nr:hypothetical protein A1Q1_01935 [Trichosporon asahii var. asahii CBS 2479]EJT49024.1 hypothetical protein A1Q1_01935 [Trichosporon asahii var. asahii CBS 2479]EKC97771.1 hypothetical protein A1Q2_07970 [Trichosporon asahii var. asahii CBS 8904]
MKSPELLESTASEPLTIEEEREMQMKWQEDDDIPDAIASCPMIGDVNLFLPDGTAGDVECEIMLAEPSFRGKGYAREALSLFPLGIGPSQFIARIGAENAASLRLFDSLGFGQVKLVEVWNEIELRWGWNNHSSAKAQQWAPSALEGRIGVYA